VSTAMLRGLGDGLDLPGTPKEMSFIRSESQWTGRLIFV